LGNKNRIFLGLVIKFILHFHRNFFLKKPIYMSKRVQEKIKNKHGEVFKYTESELFLLLQNSTIGSFGYEKCENTINFIAHLESDNRYILYSLKVQKNHTICSTIY